MLRGRGGCSSLLTYVRQAVVSHGRAFRAYVSLNPWSMTWTCLLFSLDIGPRVMGRQSNNHLVSKSLIIIIVSDHLIISKSQTNTSPSGLETRRLKTEHDETGPTKKELPLRTTPPPRMRPSEAIPALSSPQACMCPVGGNMLWH